MHPLTDTWWELFINRTDGCLRAHERGWFYTPQEITRADISRALTRPHALGIYATSPEGFSRWLCLDADTEEAREDLTALARDMEAGTSLFELSRRGAHLWRFCPPTPWREVRNCGLWLCEEASISCEVFPKSGGRTGVRLPLTVHPKTGKRYPAIDPATGEVQSIASLLQLRPAPLPVVELHDEPPTVSSTGECTRERQTGFAALYREISQVTRLRQYGPERAIGYCPFHDDAHPSLSIVGGFWRCWAGCGEGGLNAFRARMRQRGGR